MESAAPGNDRLLFRIRRVARLSLASLSASRGLTAKWAMCRCITSWFTHKLGTRRSHEMDVTVDGLRMRVDAGRAEIGPFWEIWFERSYQELPQFMAHASACVVDVGANVGFYTLRQARRAPHGRVVAFEPAPTVFGRLKFNIEANGATNVLVVNRALGAHKGTVNFVDAGDSINARVVDTPTTGSVEVQCDTLDSALQELGVGEIDILKVDTEGFEQAVLRGALQTLPRVKRMVVEVHKDWVAEKRAIDDLVAPFGFRPVAQNRSLIYYDRPPA